MSVSIHGYLSGNIGAQDGAPISESTGTNPIVGTLLAGQESDTMLFNIRLDKSNEDGVLLLKPTANTSGEYTFSATNGYNDSLYPPYNIFNSIDIPSKLWLTLNGSTGSLTIKKNTDNPLRIAGYKIVSIPNGKESSNSDGTGGIIGCDIVVGGVCVDSIASGTIPNGNSGTTRMFPSPITAQVVTFKLTPSPSANYMYVGQIQLILAGDELPNVNTVTVSAEGVNSAQWAFASKLPANVAKNGTISYDGVSHITPINDSGVIGEILKNDEADENAVALWNNTAVVITLPSTLISRIVIKNPTVAGRDSVTISAGATVECDGVVIATNETAITKTSSAWDIELATPIICKSIAIRSKGVCIISRILIYEGGFNGYGVPLLINGKPALKDVNIAIYAKYKSVSSTQIGIDNSTKLKIECT